MTTKTTHVRAGLSTLFYALVLVSTSACTSTTEQISDLPDTPFKLATFELLDVGATAVGMVLGDQILELTGAGKYLVSETGLEAMVLPNEMRALIENYDTAAVRLYQIANFFQEGAEATLPFVHAIGAVRITAPIKYPWNVLAAAANYRAHAEGMAAAPSGENADNVDGMSGATDEAGSGGGFDPSRIAEIDPARDAPVMFAKSPRSGIIDPGEPYFIPPGRDQIDWEGEMAVIIGKPAYLVSAEEADDYVFGYSIMYDVSDRGGRPRGEGSMFPGVNWFDGKSTNRGAPFGPFIVPKEFIPDPANLRVTTKVNGELMQDQTTADLIWSQEHLIAFTTSILTLYPGDVIATGTPSGTGAERGEFLKAGDVVEIEIEGIGILRTPIEDYPGSET
ncbi:MAG TPA: fumarylacetoacetate hydrolase family protein [Acidobacteria bacterium]|jgi:2-keto-4-pentenoate hydratase/2-oxohepta-3-ene-1,7-dioic acid hydratase in catechol pathway|nr:fumarylacetoacetate hydrolase family protein [Acidobacteriota bacterium]